MSESRDQAQAVQPPARRVSEGTAAGNLFPLFHRQTTRRKPGNLWSCGSICRDMIVFRIFLGSLVFLPRRKPSSHDSIMAPTEAAILTNYLLIPAQLPAIISLKGFTELFPRAQQSSPQIRRLYRDLQTQRNALIDDVTSNIVHEAKRGKVLRREALRAKREAEGQEVDDEIDIERAVRPPHHLGVNCKCGGMSR